MLRFKNFSFLSRPQEASIYNVIILNTPIRHKSWATSCIKHAKSIVCADGGANRLYELNSSVVPHIICGDLDSLSKEVQLEYEARGAKIQKIVDQDRTDLQKSIDILSEDDEPIVIIGGAGRLDQDFGNINALVTEMEKYQDKRLVVIMGENIYEVLSVGKHEYDFSDQFEDKASSNRILDFTLECGIFPIVAASTVSTDGLLYNLSEDELRFGGLVSSSNTIVQPKVTIETDSPLLWTASVSYRL